ncbi:MAG: L-fucose:H+ symporter permease [Kiritimatiellia bacterium]|jgi:FHS family L-fucose permease-like MFS transporter|nr:L-fucose:H+ symporter permease [Kiritimatiellia bacterium]
MADVPVRSAATRVVQPQFVFPFVLTTTLFALWGFANDITNPMVAAFKAVFIEISNTESSLVQFAFYGGYATMAIPAALFIRKYSYKSGILLGLALYSFGALLFLPAAITENFFWFPFSLYILTFGLAFLETTANPYILSMGSPETATRRLNLAQAFNPMGSLLGMVVASKLVLRNLKAESYFKNITATLHAQGVAETDLPQAIRDFVALPANRLEYAAMKTHDITTIRNPYVILGVVVAVFFFLFLVSRIPSQSKTEHIHPIESAKRLLRNRNWVGGVIAQTFYVAAQITCWTYIIQYAGRNCGFTAERAQDWNIVAMIIFLSSRFICTFLLKYLNASLLLALLAVAGAVLTSCTIVFQNLTGLACLVGVSACMSLMFPTIYGIALDGLGEDAKLGSAGLIFAIVGGALMPMGAGWFIDQGTFRLGSWSLTGESAAFTLPLLSFLVIAAFGWITFAKPKRAQA